MRGIEGEQVLLRIILSESRTHDRGPLFRRLLELLRAEGLAGTTVLKGYLDSLVPPERWLLRGPPLGEESRGWMVVRMGSMMGEMMGRGMMHQMPGRP